MNGVKKAKTGGRGGIQKLLKVNGVEIEKTGGRGWKIPKNTESQRCRNLENWRKRVDMERGRNRENWRLRGDRKILKVNGVEIEKIGGRGWKI